jgi:hypothetical protein
MTWSPRSEGRIRGAVVVLGAVLLASLGWLGLAWLLLCMGWAAAIVRIQA